MVNDMIGVSSALTPDHLHRRPLGFSQHMTRVVKKPTGVGEGGPLVTVHIREPLSLLHLT